MSVPPFVRRVRAGEAGSAQEEGGLEFGQLHDVAAMTLGQALLTGLA
ncbi:hypothetical protein [Acrocarpospora sp. B8E8]